MHLINHRARLVGLLAAPVLVIGLASCSGGEADQAGAATSTSDRADGGTGIVPADRARKLIAGGATAIDVRTAEEYADGHLDQALNLDALTPQFADMVALLPRDDAYVVYCRSGNRATAAVATMLDLGFTDVVNGGGYADLAVAG